MRKSDKTNNQSVLRNKTVFLLKFGFIVILLSVLYFPEIRDMVFHWVDKKEYSHGFLIPAISLYLVWRKRDELKNISVMPDGKGILLMAAGIVSFVIGNIAFEPSLRQYSLVVTLIGLIYFLSGKEMYKALLFPAGYLLFMVPLPYIIMNTIAMNLRLVNAWVAYSALNFFGIPILREGANLELPSMSLVVADLCTGILSLVAIMALAVFYAYISLKKNIFRVALIFLAVPVAIFSNMLRLIMTVGLAYFYGQRILGDIIHQFHGTVNFFITVFFLVLAGNLINRVETRFNGNRK